MRMVENAERRYDVVIIGAGVTGAALLHVLAKYTDIPRVAVLEKYGRVAEVSSHASHNSQTLHFGDIETNYTLEKAALVKDAAEMVVRYVDGLSESDGIFRRLQKMVLGVGDKEVASLRARFEEFKGLFPETRLLGPSELRELEPKTVEGRDPAVPVAAIYNPRGFAVDFGKLAESFVREARRARPEGYDLFHETSVRGIVRRDGKFFVSTDKGAFIADAVVVAAGAYSLRMAHSMGLGRDLTLLPVAGDFFTAPNMLRGKVYTVQEKKLPFAAVHADPEVGSRDVMRLGPVALAVPLLEPRRWRSMIDFFRIFRLDGDTIATVMKVNAEPVVARFIARHVTYYLPFVGKRLFMREARKIIPTLRAPDVTFGKDLGGIRPQVANKKTRSLQLGEAKIVDEGIIFNITPSPGASVCLKNAEDDVRRLIGFLGGRYRLDENALRRDLK